MSKFPPNTFAARLSVAIFAVVLFWSGPAQGMPIEKHHEGCLNEQDMHRFLEAEGERRVWTGHHSAADSSGGVIIGGLVEIWESGDTSAVWTILTTIAGQSCIRARGGTSTWEYPWN